MYYLIICQFWKYAFWNINVIWFFEKYRILESTKYYFDIFGIKYFSDWSAFIIQVWLVVQEVSPILFTGLNYNRQSIQVCKRHFGLKQVQKSQHIYMFLYGSLLGVVHHWICVLILLLVSSNFKTNPLSSKTKSTKILGVRTVTGLLALGL